MQEHVVIVGGGLAGLSAGCHARANGFRTTIVEHNLALGGVCTAWPRDGYLVDGCIHWLTGGPFMALYEELGIPSAVELRPIEHWASWRDWRTGVAVDVTRDLGALSRRLSELGSQRDAVEIERLIDGARRFCEVPPPGLDRPPDLATIGERIHAVWNMRGALGTFVHFGSPTGEWAAEHLTSDTLRRFFLGLVPDGGPALILLMILGYLERGFLSRPRGGTAAFRDALVAEYRRRGGEALLHSTVDEVLVEGLRTRGVRLGDGTILEADAVISRSSLPETVQRLLGGRFGGKKTEERMRRWELFDPIVLASFGVDRSLAELPGMLLVDRLPPLDMGGRSSERLYLRICNDDPAFAPTGHAVVQALALPITRGGLPVERTMRAPRSRRRRPCSSRSTAPSPTFERPSA